MRLLHLEMPRGLSFTLREWSSACARAAGSDRFRQIDLNFDVWQCVLADERDDGFGRLVDAHHHAPRFLAEVLRASAAKLARRAASLHCGLGLSGVRFPASAWASAAALRAYVANCPDRAFFDSYFRRLCERHMLLSAQSFLSLGVDSEHALVFAALLAEFVRRHDPDVRICLTRHQYENFSLVRRLDEITAEGSLFSLFDAVVHYEERIDEAIESLIALFERGDASSLTNVAVAVRGKPKLFPVQTGAASPSLVPIDPAYVRATGVPPDRLVYFTPLVRNACYYGRCSFCVQNERYLAPQAHKYAAEVDRAITLITDATARGVTSFSFSDQALHPTLLRAFTSAVAEQSIDIAWCGRMLFDPAALDDGLLRALRRSGCRELLFGVESFRRETLAAMDKDFGADAVAGAELVRRIEDHGLDVVLSLMFGFPSEPDEAFEHGTLAPLAKIVRERSNVTVILNRFALFRDTPMERAPESFGIARLIGDAGPFAQERRFVDVHGRDNADTHPREAEYREALREYPATDADELVAHVAYSSLGLRYRWRTGRYFPEALATDSAEGPWRASGGVERDVLVLGSNAYLGQNLALALDASRLVLSSRSARNEVVAQVEAPCVHADLARSPRPLGLVSPREVYVVARPETTDFAHNSAFAANLKNVLFAWARSRRLERVVLASTQLVYATPTDASPVGSSTELAPRDVYEYFKTELERFLRFLSARFGVAVEIVRLPLVFGGAITGAQRRDQLLYAWVDAMRAGGRWSFADATERTYGNSWVYMPDVARAFVRAAGPGVHVRQPTSGDFRYAELQQAVFPTTPADAIELPLVRSHFFLRDEEGMVPRDLATEVARDLSFEIAAPAKASRPTTPADPDRRRRLATLRRT